jgi:hypothetical protein
VHWSLSSKTGARITEQIGALNSALRASVKSTSAQKWTAGILFPVFFFVMIELAARYGFGGDVQMSTTSVSFPVFSIP